MSNSSLQPDQDALRESAIAVITYVRDAMHEGVALLREHDRLLVENQGEHRLESEIQAINENLRHVNDNLERVKRGELTMTIVAPTSAGKSTIINAIAGQDLLPSRKDAMTVLPTEIVFIFSRDETPPPKLILGNALKTLLREAWRLLHQQLQRIGLDEAIKQATKNDFARKNVIKEIFNSSVFPLSEEVKPDDIQSALIKINDLLRLCGIFGIPTGFLSSLSEIPRIEVPFPPELSSLEDLGLGTLVLVDTPGPSEDKSLNLVKVVEDRLKKSSLILVVVDSEKVGQTDPVKVKKLVDKIAADKGRDRISIIVNRIDTRKKGDLTTEETLNLVQTQYEITKDRIFETSALRAFLATNFRRERRILEPTELRKSESFNSLGEAYYGDSWEDRKEDISLSEMDNASDKYWQKSGFADFTKKAIAPLVKDVAPSMITIKGALNDIGEKLLSLQSCLKKQKEMLVLDIQKAADDTEWIKADLHEIELIKNDNGWRRISDDIYDNLFQIAFEEINIIVENQRSLILDERNAILEKISDDIIDSLLRESAYEAGREAEKFMIYYYKYRDKISEFYLQLSLDKNTKIKLINGVNHYLTHCHNSLFDNAQRRLSRNLNFFSLNLKDVSYLNSFNDSAIYRFSEREMVQRQLNAFEKDIQQSGALGKMYHTLSTQIHDEKSKYEAIAGFSNNKATKMLDQIYNSIEQVSYSHGFAKRVVSESRSQIETLMNALFLLVEDYEKYLQSLIKAVKQKQDIRCMVMTNKYVQALDKIANLEIDLKYQQEYVKQH